MNHAMIDIETLGLAPGSSIISIGAVMFTRDGISEMIFHSNVRRDSNANWGMKEDPKTLTWWNDTDPELLSSFEKNAHTLGWAIADLSAWCTLYAIERVWANGPSFDIAHLEHAYRVCGIPIPWKYNASRCVRTVLDEAGIDAKAYPQEGRKHHPVDDAIFQARTVLDAWGIIHGKDRMVSV